MHFYKNIIVLDIEFVCSKKWNQPFQISMISFNLKKDVLTKISDFDIYIDLMPGNHLNSFARKVTGISEDFLNKEGLYYKDASYQVLNYLLHFNLEDTLIVGWSPQNDIRMLDILFNHDEPMIDMNALHFFDLNKSYNKFKELPSCRGVRLEEACEDYGIKDEKMHNSYADTVATAKLLENVTVELYKFTWNTCMSHKAVNDSWY